MISDYSIFNWPPPFNDQWATTYLQVLFQGFLFALGVPTAIYSLIVDNDIKRVAQTRVQARRFFVATGLLYLAAFILVWFIHPSPEQPPNTQHENVAPIQQAAPTSAITPRLLLSHQKGSMETLAPALMQVGRPREQTGTPKQDLPDRAAAQPDGSEQISPQKSDPQDQAKGLTERQQSWQQPAPATSWSLIIKSTFAATTVTILPFVVLVLGLRLNRQFRRAAVVERLANTLLETFETKGILDAMALGDLGYLGEHGKAGEEKKLVLDVVDHLAERVQEKVKAENVNYRGFELEQLIRHIPIMLDNTTQPGNDQNYRRAVEVLANIWRWLSIRRNVTEDSLSTREALRQLSLQAVKRTGEETALAFLEIAADCDSNLVFEIGLTAFKLNKYLLAAAALTKLEEIVDDAITTNAKHDVQTEALSNLLGMAAHFASAGPSGARRAETALQINQEFFVPTLRRALDDAFDYHYDAGHYETADKIKQLTDEAGKKKAVDLDCFRIAIPTKPRESKSGNEMLDQPKHEQERSTEQRVMVGSKRKYIVATLFAITFIASTVTLLIIYKSHTTGNASRISSSSDVAIWITFFTAIVSAIGTFSTIILAWMSNNRQARLKELEIAQLERELVTSSEKPSPPTIDKSSK